MHTSSLVLAGALALAANAVPLAGHSHHQHLHTKRDDTFNIHVLNSCPDTKSFGLFQIDGSFNMNSMSDPVSVTSGQQATIPASFTAIGMCLSATADQGTAAQWDPQALFEFGYSSYGGQDGTAYDVSLMSGSPADIATGVAIYPLGPSDCPIKVCTLDSCDPSQGWTSPGQVDAGSPGDTVCYHGVTDFRVVFCP